MKEKTELSARNRAVLWIVLFVSLGVLGWMMYLMVRDGRDARQEVETLNEVHRWVASYEYVDKISVYYNSALHIFSLAEHGDRFEEIKDVLNPFIRTAVRFSGNVEGTPININRLESLAQITYHINDIELFYVKVYLVPENINRYVIERLVSLYEGERAVVVVSITRHRGRPNVWLGQLGVSVLDMQEILRAGGQ